MAQIDHYAALIAIIEHGSLTAASRNLRRSLQSVSRLLGELERELGVELVRRTTRSCRPTPAGLAFAARARIALAELEDARREAVQDAEVVSGTLRLAGPTVFGPRYIVPPLTAFMERYRDLEVELMLADRFVDLVAEQIDLAIRIGDLRSSDLRARRLAGLRRVFFAAPGYLARHGRPQRPVDLAHHRCVIRTVGPEAEGWPVADDGKAHRLRVVGSFRSDNAAACNEAVMQGQGIGMAPLWQVRDLVDQGRLELLLQEYEPPPVPVSAVWVAGNAMPARVRLFIDFLAARFSAERW